jgi:aminopeptidase N
MRRFLRYELDSYLTGRSLEKKREVPLVRVEDQPYIHYRKGSLVMYELQDAIGEASVNQALRAFLDRYEFKGPPYPNANALLDEFKRVTPAESQPLLYDLFEAITLYDLRAQHAEAHKRPDGKYETSLSVTIKKIWAADQGQETVVPFDQLVDIAALDAKGEPLYLQKLRLASGESVLTLITDELPAKAGIDPLNKLIDRDPDDNVVNVTGP